MNSQREVIYKKRRHALFGERLAVDVANMIYDLCEQIVDEYQSVSDYENFKLELYKTLATESPFDEQTFLQIPVEKLTDELFEKVYKESKKEKKK